MFPAFLPAGVTKLAEFSAITLAQSIKRIPVLTPLHSQPIHTAYIHQGSGKIPLLLLHGFDSSVLEFYRLIPYLKAQTEVWAIDLLGFGFTERITGLNHNPSSLLIHLYQTWKTVINQPIILLGASMGGATAIDFALTYPEIVQKLILIDSVGYSGSFAFGQFLVPPFDAWAVEFWKQRKQQALNWGQFWGMKTQELAALQCVSVQMEMPGWKEAMISWTHSGGYLHLSDTTLRNRIFQLDIETLILWGDRDTMLGTEDAFKFHKNIANSQLQWISNSDHSPQLEQPQITARFILDFL
ncbi:MAG: alpha/beta hydrolase [Cyanobacteriota bacterium]|nr:alpha/beta hydrolase [Cyanobacteriota bacterium]